MSSSKIQTSLTSELGELTTAMGAVHLTGDLVPARRALMSDGGAVHHEAVSALRSVSGGVPPSPHDPSSRSEVPDSEIVLKLKEESASPLLGLEKKLLERQDLASRIKKEDETNLLKEENDNGLVEVPLESEASSQQDSSLNFGSESSSYTSEDERSRSPVAKGGSNGDHEISDESADKLLGTRKYFATSDQIPSESSVYCISLHRNLIYAVGGNLKHTYNGIEIFATHLDPPVVDFSIGYWIYRWDIKDQVLQSRHCWLNEIWNGVTLYDDVDSARQSQTPDHQVAGSSTQANRPSIFMSSSSPHEAIDSNPGPSGVGRDTSGLQQGLNQGTQLLPLESPIQSQDASTQEPCLSHTWLMTDNKSKENIDEYVKDVQTNSNKKYLCPVDRCEDKKFERRDALKDHLYGHYRIRAYPCDRCAQPSYFTTRCNMRRHIEEAHEGKCRYCKEATPPGQRKKNHKASCTQAKKGREVGSTRAEGSKRRKI